jgi:hypothetical protein
MWSIGLYHVGEFEMTLTRERIAELRKWMSEPIDPFSTIKTLVEIVHECLDAYESLAKEKEEAIGRAAHEVRTMAVLWDNDETEKLKYRAALEKIAGNDVGEPAEETLRKIAHFALSDSPTTNQKDG